MKKYLLVGCLVLSAAILPACGDDDAVTGEQACNDFIDSLAERFHSCGASDTQAEAREELIKRTNFQCDEAVGLRDEDEFYNKCIPSIEALSCDDLINFELDPSCNGQIQVSAD